MAAAIEPSRVEQIAKLLFEADPRRLWPVIWGWDKMPETKKNAYRSMARAVAGF